MNLYNLKHYSLLALYHALTVVRGLLLLLVTPLSWLFETLHSIISEWEPSKPLHKSAEIDYDNPDNYGI